MEISGSCHCGNISYTAKIDPEKVIICHCTDCQSLSATAFRTVVPVLAADLKLSGAVKIYVKTGGSGARRQQAFCPDCGAGIFAAADETNPQTYNLRLGTCAQRAYLVPKKQLWTRSALPWLKELDSVPSDMPEK